MSKKTKFLKRGLAFLLAMIIALGSAMTAFAATSRTTWNGHNRFKVNGNDAYCIDFSAVSASSGSVSSTAYKTWNSLPSANKKKIELAITAAHNLGYYNSSDVKYFSVQYYIWMCSCKSAANASLSNWFKNEVKPYYDNVDKEVNRLWSIGVNFTDDRTLTNIPYDVGVYVPKVCGWDEYKFETLECVKKAKKTTRKYACSEMLLMMFRSANRELINIKK